MLKARFSKEEVFGALLDLNGVKLLVFMIFQWRFGSSAGVF